MKNPFSLEALADWCRRQGDKPYDYLSISRCALGQYCRAHGLEYSSDGKPFGPRVEIIAATEPRTFAALADRIDLEIAESSIP